MSVVTESIQLSSGPSSAISMKSRAGLMFETPTITIDNYSDRPSEEAVISRANVDPKLIQAAQLFVQDLIARATIEVQKKLSSSERQALLHEDTFFQEDRSGFLARIRQEVAQRCQQVYNLFLNCLGNLP